MRRIPARFAGTLRKRIFAIVDWQIGVTIMMREIDAPIRIFGKHWGGFRTAYNL